MFKFKNENDYHYFEKVKYINQERYTVLNKWERSFIKSLLDNQHRKLSEKQMKNVDRIFSKVA